MSAVFNSNSPRTEAQEREFLPPSANSNPGSAGASASGSNNNNRNGVQINGNLSNHPNSHNHAHSRGSSIATGSVGGVNGIGTGMRRASGSGFGFGYGGSGSGSGSAGAGASGSGSGGFGERAGGGAGGYGYGYGYGNGSGSGGGSEGGSRASKHQEELINAYEAEEERIINVLSKKLEQLREDKIELENALEAESESHVNKLSRELVRLRAANRGLEEALEAQKAQNAPSASSSLSSSGPGPSTNGNGNGNGHTHTTTSGLTNALANANANANNTSSVNLNSRMVGADPSPSAMMVLDALRRENEQLRGRLVGTEREYVRLKRLNEVYREELIECRGRLGLPVDNLIGLTPADRDPFSQPTHVRRQRSSESYSNSPSSDYFAPWGHGHANGNGRVDERAEGLGEDGGRHSGSGEANSPSFGDQGPGMAGVAMAMSYKPRFLGGGGYAESVASGSTSSRTNSNTILTRGQSSSQLHPSTLGPPPLPHHQSVPIPLPRPASRIRRHEHATLMGVNGDVDGDVDVDVDGVIEVEGEGDVDVDGDGEGEGEELEGTEVDSVPVSSTSSSSGASSSLLYAFSPSSSVAEHRHHHHHHHQYHHHRGGQPGSYASVDTDVTSPPSSGSFGLGMGVGGIPQNGGVGPNGNGVGMGGAVMGGMGMSAYMVPQRGLTYPSVPPPSLSSSFGSPSVGMHGVPLPGSMSREASTSASPVESFSLSRRGSNAGGSGNIVGGGTALAGRRGSESGGVSGSGRRVVVETGSLGLRRGSLSSFGPMPAGGRVAETGTLQRRSRAGSVGFAGGSGVLPDTVDELDADDA